MNLFPDTHFFLHYRNAQDVAWSEVTDQDDIRLVIGRAVAKELDRKKFELRGRPQDRARLFVSKLGAIASGTSSGALREKAPRIVLEMAPQRPTGWVPPADLDSTWGDDVLLADVLAFRHGHPGADAAILTGDPGLMAKARVHGVRIVSLLDRGWELAEEKTSEQKEVEKLRREVHDLKQVGPSIACELVVGDKAHAALDLEVVQHLSLSDDMVDELLSGLKLKHPKVVEFPCPASPDSREPGTQVLDLDDPDGPTAWTAPERDEMDAYSTDYDRWVDDAGSFIRDASASFVAPLLEVLVDLVLRNDGSGPAEGVQLFIEAQGGFLISDVEEESESESPETGTVEAGPSMFRSPPRPPRWKKRLSLPSQQLVLGRSAQLSALLASQVHFPGLTALNASMPSIGQMGQIARVSHLLDGLADSGVSATLSQSQLAAALAMGPPIMPPFPRDSYLMPPRPRDRCGFYSCETPASRQGTGIGYECEEFRHRMESRSFEFRLAWDTDKGLPRNGAVRIRLSARNMRETFETTIPIRVGTVQADMRHMVEELLP